MANRYRNPTPPLVLNVEREREGFTFRLTRDGQTVARLTGYKTRDAAQRAGVRYAKPLI